MELIYKDALVAEIEKIKIIARENAEIASANNNVPVAALWSGKENICNELLSFLDTLEVKDVDLEKEIEKCLKRHNMLALGRKDFTDIAKYFFELGLKVQKGE